MLDAFAILTRGGLVLWSYKDPNSNVLGNPINALIQTVLAEGRGKPGEVFQHDSHALQYELDNERALIFVAVYNRALTQRLTYLPMLLAATRRIFLKTFQDALVNRDYSGDFEFDTLFNTLRAQAEEAAKAKESDTSKQPRSFEDSKKFQKTKAKKMEGESTAAASDKKKKKKRNKRSKVRSGPGGDDGDGGDDDSYDDEDGDYEDEDEDVDADDNNDDNNDDGEESGPVGGADDEATSPTSPSVADKLKELERRKAARPGRTGPGRRRSNPSPSSTSASPSKKTPKKNQTWGMQPANTKLSYGEDAPAADAAPAQVSVEDAAAVGKMRIVEGLDVARVSLLEDALAEDEQEREQAASKTSGVFSYFTGLVGSSTITEEALKPVLAKMHEHLVSKNVASDIADKLCESVSESLVGKTKGSFRGLASVVRETVEAALTRILSPKRQVDILRSVLAAKAEKRPYTIVFCGVNGVGKSTNLSKIAFWLLENDLRVCIAACDTFRAGAVEQLKTHVAKLNVLHPADQPKVALYDQGYGKDAAGIAADAFRFGYDVVLVDTAGRMQSNRPLMQALAKLVRVNNPDLVLFVGEALVGSEAVDQMAKFNEALADFGAAEHPRLLDAIVLTKFDTVDSKVGAAISMSYISGQPIVFVGTGQRYGDLRKLDVKSVVALLMSS